MLVFGQDTLGDRSLLCEKSVDLGLDVGRSDGSEVDLGVDNVVPGTAESLFLTARSGNVLGEALMVGLDKADSLEASSILVTPEAHELIILRVSLNRRTEFSPGACGIGLSASRECSERHHRVLQGLHLNGLNTEISGDDLYQGNIVMRVQIVSYTSASEAFRAGYSVCTRSVTNEAVSETGFSHLSAIDPGGNGGLKTGPITLGDGRFGAHGFPSTIHSFELVGLGVHGSISIVISRTGKGACSIVLDFEVIPVAHSLRILQHHVEVLELFPGEAG